MTPLRLPLAQANLPESAYVFCALTAGQKWMPALRKGDEDRTLPAVNKGDALTLLELGRLLSTY